MIKVCSLSSGSNGNSFFITTGEDSFLVDAGISCRQIGLRLGKIGFNIEDIKGVFITHEHSDHIQGLDVLLRNYDLKVYLSNKTSRKIFRGDNPVNYKIINPGESVNINKTRVLSLAKQHDAVDPSVYCFFYEGRKISVITDTGEICPNIIEAVRDASIIFLESNYDEKMLKTGSYPYFLKRRIEGSSGHLSNRMAGELIYKYATAKLSHIFLSHLSENNNRADLALETFKSIVQERKDLKNLKILLTSRHRISDLVSLRGQIFP
jgi:phosphoribosyl 1,2-cyclic phosphodiesterase